MLTARNALNAAILLWLAPAALCQMAPLPSDRLEPVSGLAEVVSNPDKRSAAFDLLERARWNYNLHAPGREPFSIKLSFVSSGQAALEGTGTMEETWVVPSSWRWTASFANTAQVRVGNSGEIYGTTDPVPLRVQMVRAALFWPINFAPSFVVRSAHVKFEGEKIDCLLLSGAVPGGAASRFWVETEYCVDPKTGLLKVWSEAPGIYTIYDYADAPVFHGHTLPRQITVHENGDTVLKVRIENIEDARDVDPKLFQPTPEMIAQGPSFTLSVPTRFPMPVDPDPGTPAWIQPVIVHATIGDYDGQVLDAEPLQTSNRQLADAALQLVRNSSFDPTGMQREVFINVQFHQPQNYNLSIFLERVHRVVLVRRERLRRPPHRTRGPIPGNHFGEGAGDHF